MNFTIITAKLVAEIGKLMGRGSALPGYVARKMDKRILEKMDLPKTRIMVTGTNGKTSTTHFISAILQENGLELVHNKEGANMPQGIASILIKEANLSGEVDKDALVLEVDEGYLRSITDEIWPSHLVMTNVFPDQADRFGSVENVAQLIASGIKKDTRLIVNGDDPNLVYAVKDLDNPKIFYSIKGQGQEPEEKCPNCGKKLNYQSASYANLGEFSCDCGFKSPEIKYRVEDVDLDKGEFTLDGYRFKTSYKQDYFIYNILAATSLGLDLGIEKDTIQKAIENYKIGGGRMEEITFGEWKTFFNLVKNPAGLDRTVDYINRQEEKHTIFLAINAKPADGEDLSWLKDIDYTALKDPKIEKIYIDGLEKEKVYQTMSEKIDREKLILVEKTEESLKEIKESGIKPYFLANYTAMATLKDLL